MNNKVISKICTGCGEDKPLEDYGKETKGKYGRASKCKQCIKTRDSKYYDKNSEKVKTRRVERYHEDVSKSRAYEKGRYNKRVGKNE